MRRELRIAAPLLLLLSLGFASASSGAAAAGPPVTLDAFTVQPADPAADTLCKLTVTLSNHGEHVASQLGFDVRINGQELVVYRNQLFMYPIQPGKSAEIPLYNFWSTETSRPMPADGKLNLEITLREARWFDISTDAEGVEVWQPVAPVDGLPSVQKKTLTMKR
jgi:hypothetical protein